MENFAAPTSGVPGTSVTVSGSGFGAAQGSGETHPTPPYMK